MEKTELRKRIKQSVKQLTSEEKESLSMTIWKHLEQMPEFESAKTILLFWSLPDEVQTSTFIEKWQSTKKILLPVVIGDNLGIREYKGDDKMQTGSFNIQEPVGIFFTSYDQIDLILVPGVGFNKKGIRLGRGKGYYDRFLPKLNAPKFGICYPCQIIEDIPTDKWDIPVDRVIFQ